MESHMFPNASIGTISGGTFINNARKERLSLEKLSAAAAHSALHNAPARSDGTRCHQGTRTSVLDRLERWAQGLLDENASIFWLHGGAGAGKSAVMQTLAERFAAQGLALGSFFFSRGDNTRNTAEVLVPTLVYQLAQVFPSALKVLDPIIDRDPLIFKKNFQVQLLDLFVRPLEHLVHLRSISNASRSPRVFLIDGLDECSNPIQQKAIIQAAAAVCHQHHIPVKFLIASRLELAISTSFGLYTAEDHVLGIISLSEDDDAPSDIRNFIEAEFLKIRLQHPFRNMIPSKWPDRDQINTLVKKSSSHFIYASTVTKYFWSSKKSPIQSLRVILGLEVTRTTSPFAELDSLYCHILTSIVHCHEIVQLLAYCIYMKLPPSPFLISFMLDYSEDNLSIYLAEITPLVGLVLSQRRDSLEVKLLHASLGDFLRDSSRSGPLYTNEEAYLASKFDKCFQLMAIPQTSQSLYPATNSKPLRITYRPGELQKQVSETIVKTGGLVVTQQVLGQYGLLTYFEWLIRPDVGGANMTPDDFADFVEFFFAVYSIKTSEGATLFKGSVKDFFNILDSHPSLQKKPLVAAIFRLTFSGYPIQELPYALAACFGKPQAVHTSDKSDIDDLRMAAACRAIDKEELLYDIHRCCILFEKISAAQIVSVQHDINTSSECLLAVVAEVVLQIFLDASGDILEWPKWLLFGHKIMPPILANVILWTLPKAAASQKVALYSKRIQIGQDQFPKFDSNLIQCLSDCLNDYNTRVQNVKLEELAEEIANGNVNALIEKSRMYLLNDQD